MTIRAGVAGSPAKHSLSPLIHGAWLKAAGIDGEYGLFDLAPDRFAAFVETAWDLGLRGINVTLPFKEQALNLSDDATETAQLATAANLLIFEADGRIRCDNTDGIGLIHALKTQAPGFDYLARPIVMLGAGGAAKGAAAALANAGAGEIRLVNRTPGRAEQLAVELMLDFETNVVGMGFDEAIAGAGLLINAASAGMGGRDDRGLDLARGEDDLVVMDMVYAPLETPLLAAARARGLVCVDGLEMLIGQAAPSFEALFRAKPPAGVDVRALAIAELERRGVKVIGLTGSIGMGKTTTAGLFAEAGVMVHDADAEVHALYQPGGAAVGPIEAAFPGVVKDGAVDRKALGDQIIGNVEAMRALEHIVHPLMGQARAAFFERAKQAGADLVVLDVPLLFETGGDQRVDVVVVASAPEAVQRERVLARPGMSEKKLQAILARQMSDAEKRRRADYVVETGEGIEAARAQVEKIITGLRRSAS